MLTEIFVAAISAPTKPNTTATKDVGIIVHEYQPLAAQRHVFKKSATAPHNLAISRSHIFAAQADKAIVHVYSREKGNQEAGIPFPERIHSIALAAQDTVLLLGTESGRLSAWEISSGRLVSTSTAHLQPVTCIAVDPSSNFFLSGSNDAMIHVWALPSLLSFSPDTSRSPIRTLSTHRGPIKSLVCGHSWTSANIAISIAEDKSAIVWNYLDGQALRTYLLPETPTAVEIDPADRAFYVAYADGSLQTIDFYDDVQKNTPVDALRDTVAPPRPVQPPSRSRFDAKSQKLGGALCLSLSWDGTTMISGHESGKVVTWDISKSSYLSTLANLAGPVTNLRFLTPTGFSNMPEPTFSIQTVTRPKHDELPSGIPSSMVPLSYSLHMQFVGRIPDPTISAMEINSNKRNSFDEALMHFSFPTDMLEESLAELEAWNTPARSGPMAVDFVALEDGDGGMLSSASASSAELGELKTQLAALRRIQKVTFTQLSELREERESFMDRERKRAERARAKARKDCNLANGASAEQGLGDTEMADGSDDLDASD